MRLMIAFMIILSSAVSVFSQFNADQGYSTSWRPILKTLNVRQVSPAGSSSSSGIQRRSPGKNKNKKDRSNTGKNSTPDVSSNRELMSPVTPKQTIKRDPPSSRPAPPKKQEQDGLGHGQPSSRIAKQNLKEPQKQEQLEQERRRTKPLKLTPSLEQPPTLFRTQYRSSSPTFRFSEPGVLGEGSRQGQGGARTPSDRSPSPPPPESRSPNLRTPSPVRQRSSDGQPPSRGRPPVNPRLSPLTSSSSSASSTSSRSPSKAPSPARVLLPDTPSSSKSQSPSPFARQPGRTALSPEAAARLFPAGSPNIPAEWHDTRPPGPDKFQNWLGAMRSMTETLEKIPTGSRNPNMKDIREAEQAKAKAKEARALADRSRTAAIRISNNLPAMSPHTEKAIRTSDKIASAAVAATREHTAAMTAAVFSVSGSSQHNKAIPYWKSSARQWMRAQARETYRSAHAAEYNAKFLKEGAVGLPDNHPNRGSSFMKAAAAKKVACREADQYHRCRKEYEATKAEFSGGDSSSDEAWPLNDVP